MLKYFSCKSSVIYKTLVTSCLTIFMFISLGYGSLFAVISSFDEIASKYEIVGVISSNVVVLKDKNTGNSLTRREGELLSQELKVAKINTDSVILTDSSGLGQRFVLGFDKFGSVAKSREEASKSFSNAFSKKSNSYSDIARSSSDSNNSSSNSTNTKSNNSSSVSELSQETLDLLDKFYENPDSFSSEQIKDLERRLIDGI